MAFTCPVCFYPDLEEPPQDFSICPSCGTEFGFDDAGITHEQLRKQWIYQLAPWFSNYRKPPAGWNPWTQLALGGYRLMHYYGVRTTDTAFAPESATNVRLKKDMIRVQTSATAA